MSAAEKFAQLYRLVERRGHPGVAVELLEHQIREVAGELCEHEDPEVRALAQRLRRAV